MSPKIIKRWTFLVILSIASPINAFQSRGSETKIADWELCTICGIPARIALNSSPGLAFVPQRHIYLLMEPSDFTEEKLRRVFEKLSLAYPNPLLLTINAFSNKDFLKQLIAAAEQDVIIDFADTPDGRKAAENYYSRNYPPPKGYFWARYLRVGGNEESFQYSPNAEDERTVEVILKRRMR